MKRWLIFKAWARWPDYRQPATILTFASREEAEKHVREKLMPALKGRIFWVGEAGVAPYLYRVKEEKEIKCLAKSNRTA